MKVRGSICLAIIGCAAASLIAVKLVTAQPQQKGTPAQFAAEARTFADVNQLLQGTWKLQQRYNPDGTPYRSRLEGITYISLRNKTGDLLGPHAVATLYAKETGVADPHFYDYPRDISGKPYQMESTGTWLIHNVENTPQGAQISARIFSMAKGDLQPYKNGMILTADVRYTVSRAAARAGAPAVANLKYVTLTPGPLTDFTGKTIEPTSAMSRACCGMTSFAVTANTMDIGWTNKGRDVWTKTSASVPAAFQ